MWKTLKQASVCRVFPYASKHTKDAMPIQAKYTKSNNGRKSQKWLNSQPKEAYDNFLRLAGLNNWQKCVCHAPSHFAYRVYY